MELDKNNDWLLKLSIRFYHPKMLAKDIIDNISLIPSVVKTFDKEYLKKIGKYNMIKNKSDTLTYVVFDIVETDNNDLGCSVEIANNILLEKYKFVKKFYKSGGKIYYSLYILTDPDPDYENRAAFELSPETIKVCMKLGITLGAEIHPYCYPCELRKNNKIKE
jgi:hypothetical protein